MNAKWFFISLFLFCRGANLFSQCVLSDFSLSPSACKSAQNYIQNLSGPADDYQWDFCTGDFDNAPQAQFSFNLSGANGRPGFELANDGGIWYALATGTFSNSLFRIMFGNGPSSAPTLVENFGDVGGKLSGPSSIRIIREGGLWYAFILNAQVGEIVKLNFGSSLGNSFTTSVAVTGLTPGFNSGLVLGKDNSEGWICLLSTPANNFKLIRLGAALATSNPVNLITTSIVPDQNNLGDVDLINVCGNWYGFANNFGNGNLYRLDFGTSLFSNPTITQIPSITGNPGRLRVVKDGDQYYLIVVALDGTLTKLNFGNSINSTPTIISEGNIGGTLPANVYGLGVAQVNSVWTIMTVNQANGQVFKIDYPNNCSATPSASSLPNPMVSFSQAGSYAISLSVVNSGVTSTKVKSISIVNSTAPDIEFTSQNSCASNAVNFASINSSGNLISYNWDFGNSNTSASINPSNIYASAGNYTASLNVMASNGCKNFVQKNIQIFNQPTASFSIPSASPFCTNQNYSFTNNSTSDVGSNPSWQWSVNGVNAGTTQNLSQNFTTTTSQQIILTASIPGCSTQATQTINSLTQGPLVNFTSPPTGCQGAPVGFVNSTSGSVTGYSWAFGDGNNSSLQNPSNTFLGSGAFSVSLQATNAAGCQNSATKAITIYSKPQPNFSIGLPPFSCSGSPSQFTDLTPLPTDSNIASWTWGFGDAANGLAILKNPAYTYSASGNYNVSLAVATNFGCTNSIQKSVTVAQSPVAGYSNLPACANQLTQFTDTSTGSVKSRLWQLGINTFTIPNPQFSFSSSGSFPVTLTVTGNNNCVSQISKNINVPIPPSLDFSVEVPCTNSSTLFREITNSADPSISQSWAFGTVASGSGSPAQNIFASPGNFAVRLSSTRQSGCVYSISKSVAIVNSPVADFFPSTDAGAAPLGVLFANSSTFASSYLWKFRDSNNLTSSLANPFFVFTDLGDYDVELTASNSVGCSSKANKIISVVVPRIDAVMTDFYFVKDPVTNSLQPVIKVLNRSNVSIVDPSILIDVAGSSVVQKKIIGIVRPNQELTQTLDFQIVPRTNYYVCAEVQVAGDTDLFLNRKCLSLSNDEILFTPFPNPAQAELYLDWISVNGDPVDFQIVTRAGSVCLQQTVGNVVKGINRLVVNTSALPAGIYYIRYRDSKLSKTFSFVVSGN